MNEAEHREYVVTRLEEDRVFLDDALGVINTIDNTQDLFAFFYNYASQSEIIRCHCIEYVHEIGEDSLYYEIISKDKRVWETINRLLVEFEEYDISVVSVNMDLFTSGGWKKVPDEIKAGDNF